MEHISHKRKLPSTQIIFDDFLKLQDQSKFFKFINKTDHCWIWCGTKNCEGYGYISFRKKPLLVHRLSYEIYKGPIGKLFVMHTCDHRDCLNPDHLQLGTMSENFMDMHNKGRNSQHIYRLGDDRENTKIKDEEIIFIHTKNLKKSARDIAKQFNVSTQVIYSIRTGKYPRLKRLISNKKNISHENLRKMLLGLRT